MPCDEEVQEEGVDGEITDFGVGLPIPRDSFVE